MQGSGDVPLQLRGLTVLRNIIGTSKAAAEQIRAQQGLEMLIAVSQLSADPRVTKLCENVCV